MNSPHELTASPRQNHLLASLPARDFELICPHLELVPLALGDVLNESEDEPQHVYFPTTAIVSLVYPRADNASDEIAVVGNEGLIGVAQLMGGTTMRGKAVVHSAGNAYRLEGRLLREEFHRGGALMHLLLRYTQALITDMSLTAACNRHHSLEQQLCRRLLLSLDRSSSNELGMTQQLMASLLGVRREGVTEAAGRLKSAGMIRYCRGRITVLDRPRLEKRACECYEVAQIEFDRLLPPPSPSLRSRRSHSRT